MLFLTDGAGKQEADSQTRKLEEDRSVCRLRLRADKLGVMGPETEQMVGLLVV